MCVCVCIRCTTAREQFSAGNRISVLYRRMFLSFFYRFFFYNGLTTLNNRRASAVFSFFYSFFFSFLFLFLHFRYPRCTHFSISLSLCLFLSNFLFHSLFRFCLLSSCSFIFYFPFNLFQLLSHFVYLILTRGSMTTVITIMISGHTRE